MQNLHRMHITTARPGDGVTKSVVGAGAVLSGIFAGKPVYSAICITVWKCLDR